MTKKFISIILSIIMCMCMISPVMGSAKVIEPEVVKTEKWTTSYYIDDDVDTLYPYIQCEADIYNDGTIKLYMWNTHEWDGFSTVSHYIFTCSTIPEEKSNEVDLSINNMGCELKGKYGGSLYLFNTTSFMDYSFFDPNYSIWKNHLIYNDDYEICELYTFDLESKKQYYDLRVLSRKLALSKLNFLSSRPKAPIFTFSPKVDPTGTYNFRLYGHDITVTPELLSGNIVATPSDDGYRTITYNNGSSAIRIKTDTDVSDIQKYIDELEAENALLRQENTELKNRINLISTGVYGDVNGDEVVDVQDAQIILAYYTERDVAKKSVPDLVTFGLKFGKE